MPLQVHTFSMIWIVHYKKRKKIAKWEQQALLDLWAMDCRPIKTITFTQYVQKINSKPLQEMLNLLGKA